MADFEGLATAIINGKAPVAAELTQQALAEGANPSDILTK
jgi:methanogenic corrinoid protein MtbC1